MWESPADMASEEWMSTAETTAHFMQTLTNYCHFDISKLVRKMHWFIGSFFSEQKLGYQPWLVRSCSPPDSAVWEAWALNQAQT